MRLRIIVIIALFCLLALVAVSLWAIGQKPQPTPRSDEQVPPLTQEDNLRMLQSLSSTATPPVTAEEKAHTMNSLGASPSKLPES